MAAAQREERLISFLGAALMHWIQIFAGVTRALPAFRPMMLCFGSPLHHLLCLLSLAVCSLP